MPGQQDFNSNNDGQNVPPEFKVQYKDDIKNLYEAFQNDKGEVSREEFLDLLQDSEMASNCSILVKKLQKEHKSYLTKQDFENLFSTNMSEPDNFKLVFDLIDVHESGAISLQEVDQTLKKYGLQLQPEELQMMFKYIGNQSLDHVSYEELKGALFNIEQ